MISVLFPYRDAAATVEEAAASVLDDAELGELVAIDDGSSDDGAARIARIAAHDPRVVRVTSGGVGIARALAAGLASARGELVARMDADDVSLPGRFAAQRARLDAEPTLAAVGTRVEAFPAPGDGLLAYVAWQNTLLSAEDHARELFVESPLCHPSTMIRRDALERVGGYRDGPFPEDYDLWLRLDDAGYGLAKLDMLGLRWRTTEGRATFGDPRYAPARILETRARWLAARLAREGKPVWMWGAGKTGRRLARALEPFGTRVATFIDIDPAKIGRRAREVPIVAPEVVLASRDATRIIVVAVGARGARAIVEGRLTAAGLVAGRDFLCGA